MIKSNLIKPFGSDRNPHQWYLLKSINYKKRGFNFLHLVIRMLFKHIIQKNEYIMYWMKFVRWKVWIINKNKDCAWMISQLYNYLKPLAIDILDQLYINMLHILELLIRQPWKSIKYILKFRKKPETTNKFFGAMWIIHEKTICFKSGKVTTGRKSHL